MNGRTAKKLRRFSELQAGPGAKHSEYIRHRLTGMIYLKPGCVKWYYRGLKRAHKREQSASP